MTALASHNTLAVRPATPADQAALRRLAALDSAPPLRGAVLLALADGRPVAALAVADERLAADPFVPTALAVELLRVRARQLRRRRPQGARRWRLATTPL